MVFFSIIAMVLVASLTMHFLLIKLSEYRANLHEETIPVLQTVKEIMKNGQNIVISTHRLLVYQHYSTHLELHNSTNVNVIDTKATIKHIHTELNVIYQQLKQSLEKYKTLVNKYFPDEKNLLTDVTNKSHLLIQESKELLNKKNITMKGTSIIESELKFQLIVNQFIEAIEISLAHEVNEESEREAQIQRVFTLLKNALLIITMIMCFSLLLTGWFFSKNILTPIKILINANKKLSNGDFNISLPEFRHDEFGVLATSYKNMALERNKAENSLQIAKHKLENNNKKLEQLSTTDALTQLYNRYYSEIRLEQEIDKAKRYKNIFSTILIDIDWFKLINDEFGHPAGDIILQTISKLIINNVRKVDEVFRWGGEEIFIICPEIQLDKATILAEKLRTIISQHDYNLDKQVTASFGVSQYEMNDSEKTLFKRVDQNLYEAKNSGRNKVVSS
jgi:diguanylate cyclase (GGDEF)-like protein